MQLGEAGGWLWSFTKAYSPGHIGTTEAREGFENPQNLFALFVDDP